MVRGKILNPQTGRMVSRTGKIGQQIVKHGGGTNISDLSSDEIDVIIRLLTPTDAANFVQAIKQINRDSLQEVKKKYEELQMQIQKARESYKTSKDTAAYVDKVYDLYKQEAALKRDILQITLNAK